MDSNDFDDFKQEIKKEMEETVNEVINEILDELERNTNMEKETGLYRNCSQSDRLICRQLIRKATIIELWRLGYLKESFIKTKFDF